jgi:signal transduction histidine kinase
MYPEAGKSPITPQDLQELSTWLEDNRVNLEGRFRQTLLVHIFTNRSEMHPRQINEIAANLVDNLRKCINNPDISSQAHGGALCMLGLSVDSVFGLVRIFGEYFPSIITMGVVVRKFFAGYQIGIVKGYFAANQNLILREQESFRLAFQLELDRSTAEKNQARLEAQQAIEMSYRGIILAQEEERRRIALELHDEAGQSLIGIRMSLFNLLNNGESEDQETIHNRIQKAIDLTDMALGDLRSLAYSLRPPVLDMLGLNLTLKQLSMDFSAQTRLSIHYSGTELPALSDELAISLYRFVQEALANIARHADAHHVRIKLNLEGGQITLDIKDDGIGFDPEAVTKGIGLSGMKERVRLLNGKMSIKSKPGKATHLYFQIPLLLRSGDNSSLRFD